jgi:hypothetical protein
VAGNGAVSEIDEGSILGAGLAAEHLGWTATWQGGHMRVVSCQAASQGSDDGWSLAVSGFTGPFTSPRGSRSAGGRSCGFEAFLRSVAARRSRQLIGPSWSRGQRWLSGGQPLVVGAVSPQAVVSCTTPPTVGPS